MNPPQGYLDGVVPGSTLVGFTKTSEPTPPPPEKQCAGMGLRKRQDACFAFSNFVSAYSSVRQPSSTPP